MIDNFRTYGSVRGYHGPLSNFHWQPVTYDGLTYPSAEHAFQAAKTTDRATREQFLSIAAPSDAKRFGRSIALRPDWEAVKLQVMRDVLRAKFTQPGTVVPLLATGDEWLIEGNTWGDRFWGQCPLGVGENWLGLLLMAVRAELRAS